MARYNEIPHAMIDTPREDEDAWAGSVLAAIDQVLSVDRNTLG